MRPPTRPATAATCGSSALSTTQPSGFVIRQIVALTAASSPSVWIPWRSRWSELTFVSTLASLLSYPTPRRRIPPRAVSRTATSTSPRPRIAAAPPGPVQSPGSTIRPSTTIPSDVVMPTRCPARPRTWAIMRVTVVLPFVPEMETTGIRRSASGIIVGPWAVAPEIRHAAATTSG